MGHSKDTVCTHNCMPLSILAVLCGCMHVCVTLSSCMGRKQPCVCECFKYVGKHRGLKWPSGWNYHQHDKVCEVDCIKSICSLSLCHTITNVFFYMLNWPCPFYLLLCKPCWSRNVGAGCEHRCSMDDKWLNVSSSCTFACICTMFNLCEGFLPAADFLHVHAGDCR